MEYYIEYIILQEFVVDFILLFTTGLIMKKTIKYKRIIPAAIVGVVYTIAVYTVNREFLNYFFVKFMVSILMLTIAYAPKGMMSYIKITICFYVLSILTVGIVVASYYVFDSRLTIILLFICLFFVYLLFKVLFSDARKNNENADYLREVKIFLKGNSVVVNAFIDTGNELVDTVSQRPVIIVKKDSLNGLFDKRIMDNITQAYLGGENSIMDFMLDNLTDFNFRILRYDTISKEHGFLLCVVPDRTLVKDKDRCFYVDCVVGIHNGLINKEDKYQALLFKKILSWEGERLDAEEYF